MAPGPDQTRSQYGSDLAGWLAGWRVNDRTRWPGITGCRVVRVPVLSGLISRRFFRFGCFAEYELGGLAGDVFHLGDQAAQFALVGDPFGVARGPGRR